MNVQKNMTNKEYVESIKQFLYDSQKIVERKSLDYATEDDPFRNFNVAKNIGIPVEKAILVRMADKLSRVATLLDTKDQNVKDESIKDTLMDLANYSAILHTYLYNEKQDTKPCIACEFEIEGGRTHSDLHTCKL